MDSANRRDFVKLSSVGALGLSSTHLFAGEPAAERPSPSEDSDQSSNKHDFDPIKDFSRYRPSYGGSVDSDTYLGKLLAGLRAPGKEPVPFECPDLAKIPWKMVDGCKEFQIACEPVRRELLPNKWMDFYGYNGSMPGPTIEAFQGDRIRLVVHNKLPEPTTIHWHGLELPVSEDGVPGMTQKPIPPGGTYVYEYDLHQAGTFFYHSHFPMQEAFGMAGFFIIHPKVAWDPPVDRDFGLLFQNFRIDWTQTIPDSMSMDWNWHTINGRSGPYTTPLVVRHGERVRIRILDFSPQQHHPVHLHGHTFWTTGREGARMPKSAWEPRNNTLVGVAQSTDFEFIAFNPGDWLLHCHMVHHMMNHMVRQVGPRIRQNEHVRDYKANLDNFPNVQWPHTAPGYSVPGYPQKMQGMEMGEMMLKKLWDRREVQGMLDQWHMSVHGLMTVVRVLPDDLYDRVMNGDEEIPHGQVFDEIVRRGKRDHS